MSDAFALTGEERLIDLAALRDAVAQEHFAGVRLTTASRDRLFALISRLSGAGVVTVGTIRRFVPPILAGFAQSGTRLDRDLADLIERVVRRDPVDRDTTRVPQRSRLLIWIAAAGLLIAAALWFSLSRPTQETQPTEVAAAPTDGASAKPSPVATQAAVKPRQLSETETAALVANAGKPARSALEAVISHPSLNWLPQAAEEANWSSRLPMPLHDRQFVRQLLKASAPAGGAANSDLERSVERIARAAEMAPAAELWRTLREPYAGRSTIDAEGRSANALLRTVFVRPANMPWTMASLATAVRAQARDPKALRDVDNELITRAMAIGSYDLQRPLLISDAPWSRAEEKVSALDRHLNWALATLAFIIGALAAWFALMRAPLSLDRLPSGNRTPHLPIGATSSLAGIDRPWLTRWREALGRSVPGEPSIDIEESVRATAARGGFLELRMRPKRSFANYTVAVEQRHRRDVFAAWWIRAFSAVAQSGVSLRIASFRHSLLAARETGGNGTALRLLDPAPNARLLIFGEASPRQVERWGKGWSFAGVPTMIASPLGEVLDPAPATNDRRIDLRHFAARLAALTGYGEPLDAGGDYLFDRAHDWLDESPLTDEQWYRLRGALFLHIGADGFRWLAACAIFPVLNEQLAWDAAAALQIGGGTVRIRALAGRVFATPWMRTGHFPQDIRERLMLSLDRDDVTVLHERLIGQLAVGEVDSDVSGPPGVAGGGASGIELDDPLLARFMIAPPHLPGLSPKQLPPRLRAWLMPSMGERLLRPAALRWAVPTILACIALIWLVPSANPGTVPHLFELVFVVIRFVLTAALLVGLVLIVRRDLTNGFPMASALLFSRSSASFGDSVPTPKEARAARRSHRIRRFLVLFPLLYGLGFAVIVLRLAAFIAFSDGATPKTAVPPLAGLRGEIVDRNGEVLARSIAGWTIAVHPNRVLGDKQALARQLADLVPDDDEAGYRAMLESNSSFAYVKRGASPDLVDKIQALGEPAFDFLREAERVRVAKGSLLSHVVGSTSRDNEGQSGIERAFDAKLRNPALLYQPTTLSVDSRVQSLVEADLAEALVSLRARAAGAVILDVRTGEVLAMASLPSGDLTRSLPPPNIMTQSVYEPGSVMKPITIAAALDSGVVILDQMIDARAPLSVGGFSIRDDSPTGRILTVPEVLLYSSNVATARIADSLGADRLQKTFRSLGFDQKPGIESNAGGPIWPRSWSRITTMTTGYGHGIAVPPLSIASAYAALVNGGIWRPATLVKQEGKGPVEGRRIVSATTSARMRELLRLNVTRGTGLKANVAGFRVGGQTGTAEKATAGGYSKIDVVPIYAAAFPMDAPRYVVVVTVDSPSADASTYGFKTSAWTAAPLAGRIIDHTGALLGVTRDTTRDVPQTINLRPLK